MSGDNAWITANIPGEAKTAALLDGGEVMASRVSPFTVIKRTSFDSDKDLIWRRHNDKKL